MDRRGSTDQIKSETTVRLKTSTMIKIKGILKDIVTYRRIKEQIS